MGDDMDHISVRPKRGRPLKQGELSRWTIRRRLRQAEEPIVSSVVGTDRSGAPFPSCSRSTGNPDPKVDVIDMVSDASSEDLDYPVDDPVSDHSEDLDYPVDDPVSDHSEVVVTPDPDESTCCADVSDHIPEESVVYDVPVCDLTENSYENIVPTGADLENSGEVNFGNIYPDCEECFNCQCITCEVCAHRVGTECVHCDDCVCGNFYYFSDDETLSGLEGEPDAVLSEQYSRNEAMKRDLRELAIRNNVNHETLNDILGFLRKYNVGDMPKCARTLLKTPTDIPLKTVPPGLYWHNGISKHIYKYLTCNPSVMGIKMDFSIDGVPLAKSSGSCFWPISCSFNGAKEVFLIGAYHGNEKPEDSNIFLEDFVEETVGLVTNGFVFEGRTLQFRVQCGIFDAPARSFTLKTKGHNAVCGCSKCTVEGEMLNHRMSFTDLDAPLRTEEGFRSQQQEDYHKGTSILLRIPEFHPVSSVPLDFMHLVLQGVMKKILFLVVSGPLAVRISARIASKISASLEKLGGFVPKEFARKSRSLQFLKRYKATELYLILIYIGPLALFDLPRVTYEHFLVLHVAITILADSKLCRTHLTYAKELLIYFVKTFEVIYGPEYVSHNVHSLIHLADDVEKFGHLHAFSAFKYENFLRTLLRVMRKGEKPLAQLARRFGEIDQADQQTQEIPDSHPALSRRHTWGPLLKGCSNPQYTCYKLSPGLLIDLSEKNNCCFVDNVGIVVIVNFARSSSGNVAIGRKFLKKEDLYDVPCPSSLLDIYFVSEMSDLHFWSVSAISRKAFKMPWKDGFAVFPLLN